MDEKLQEKLDKLEGRIKNARAESESHGNIEKPEIKQPPKQDRAGSEFLASVIAGGLLGYGIDWFFSTQPWGMIGFMILGFVSGVYRANQAMKKNVKPK